MFCMVLHPSDQFLVYNIVCKADVQLFFAFRPQTPQFDPRLCRDLNICATFFSAQANSDFHPPGVVKELLFYVSMNLILCFFISILI